QSKLAAMGEMLTAIAHQWRQPLNSVGLIVQDLVSAQKHEELTTQYLLDSKDRVLKQLNLMSSTIDEFRNFFSKDSLPSNFNIIDALKEVESLYWAQFKAHNIVLKLMCNGYSYKSIDNECTNMFNVYNLSSELKQVLLNIFANAKDAIVNIENATEYQREIITSIIEKEDEVVIEINDHAGGMPFDTLRRVFEPYYTTKETGTGLGLFIVKTLVDKHIKGSIECNTYTSENESISYTGTTFTLHIPKKI
ncbi:MAG: signal transduction histidine kinase, partial [Sulfurimonas sp.]